MRRHRTDGDGVSYRRGAKLCKPSSACRCLPIRTSVPPLVGFVLLLSLAGPVAAQPGGASTEATERAQAAAQSWLDRFNADDFDASWEAAATLLQQRIEQAGWVEKAEQLRDTLKTVSSRTLTATRYRATLPGTSKEGPFVLFAYRSTYETGPVNEVLVTVREDTTWKVTGYRLTPRLEAPFRTPTVPDSSRR